MGPDLEENSDEQAGDLNDEETPHTEESSIAGIAAESIATDIHDTEAVQSPADEALDNAESSSLEIEAAAVPDGSDEQEEEPSTSTPPTPPTALESPPEELCAAVEDVDEPETIVLGSDEQEEESSTSTSPKASATTELPLEDIGAGDQGKQIADSIRTADTHEFSIQTDPGKPRWWGYVGLRQPQQAALDRAAKDLHQLHQRHRKHKVASQALDLICSFSFNCRALNGVHSLQTADRDVRHCPGCGNLRLLITL